MNPIADDDSSAQPAPRGVRVSWPHLIIALLGIAISLFAYRLHLEVRAGESACSFSDTISCDRVLASPYGEFAHIPLGIFGAVYFLALLVCSFTTEPRELERQVVLTRLLLAIVGLLVSIVLTYISLVKIGAACPVCLTTHCLTLANFIVSVVAWYKLRRAGRALADRQTGP